MQGILFIPCYSLLHTGLSFTWPVSCSTKFFSGIHSLFVQLLLNAKFCPGHWWQGSACWRYIVPALTELLFQLSGDERGRWQQISTFKWWQVLCREKWKGWSSSTTGDATFYRGPGMFSLMRWHLSTHLNEVINTQIFGTRAFQANTDLLLEKALSLRKHVRACTSSILFGCLSWGSKKTDSGFMLNFVIISVLGFFETE